MPGKKIETTNPIFGSLLIRPQGIRDKGKILQINKKLGDYAEKTGFEMLKSYGFPERVADCVGGCDFIVRYGSPTGKILFAAEVKVDDPNSRPKQKKFKKYCEEQGVPYMEIHFNIPQNIINLIDHFKKEEYNKNEY